MGGFRKEFRRVSLSSKVLAAWQDPDDAGGGEGAEDADAPSDGLPGWLQLLRRAAARCLPCCAQHFAGAAGTAAGTAAEMRAAAMMQAVFRGHQARKQLNRPPSPPSPPPRSLTKPPSSLQKQSGQEEFSLRERFLSEEAIRLSTSG